MSRAGLPAASLRPEPCPGGNLRCPQWPESRTKSGSPSSAGELTRRPGYNVIYHWGRVFTGEDVICSFNLDQLFGLIGLGVNIVGVLNWHNIIFGSVNEQPWNTNFWRLI